MFEMSFQLWKISLDESLGNGWQVGLPYFTREDDGIYLRLFAQKHPHSNTEIDAHVRMPQLQSLALYTYTECDVAVRRALQDCGDQLKFKASVHTDHVPLAAGVK